MPTVSVGRDRLFQALGQTYTEEDFEDLCFKFGIELEDMVVRTSLMPGILKTVGHNKDHPKPIKIFEVGDVVLLDETKDIGASNRHYLAALYCGSTSGFELIHGLVVRIMEVIGTPFVIPGDKTGYYIQSSDCLSFFLEDKRLSFTMENK